MSGFFVGWGLLWSRLFRLKAHLHANRLRGFSAELCGQGDGKLQCNVIAKRFCFKGVERVLLALLMVLILMSLAPRAFASTVEVDVVAYVRRVIDGDTFDAFPVGRVRLADVNAPESGEPGYYEATAYLRQLVEGKRVYLDVDDLYVIDKYNRLVCVVYVRYNSTHLLNVNLALVRAGLAVISDYSNEFNPRAWSLYVYLPASEVPETYDELLSAYLKLMSYYQELGAKYDELRSKYESLKIEYEKLAVNYSKITSEYEKLMVEYEKISEYYKLMAEYESLKANYSSLQSSYNTLKSEYDKLKADYNALNTSYSSLKREHSDLKSKYHELASRHEATVKLLEARTKELEFNTNLTYTLLATSIALAATLVYIVKRK